MINNEIHVQHLGFINCRANLEDWGLLCWSLEALQIVDTKGRAGVGRQRAPAAVVEGCQDQATGHKHPNFVHQHLVTWRLGDLVLVSKLSGVTSQFSNRGLVNKTLASSHLFLEKLYMCMNDDCYKHYTQLFSSCQQMVGIYSTPRNTYTKKKKRQRKKEKDKSFSARPRGPRPHTPTCSCLLPSLGPSTARVRAPTRPRRLPFSSRYHEFELPLAPIN